jgi:cytochrome c oxidase assembly protein subunit 15
MYIENKQIKKYISFWLILMFWIITIMIIIGGLTRLTDSGLSITEWNLFSGFLPPLNDENWIKYFNLYKEIPEYKNQNYSMTLKEFKVIFWWEWIHRFLGRLIGISFLLPLIFFSLKVGVKKLANLYMIFILICLQGYIGWYMVSSGLVDRVDVSHFRLSIHLLIAFLILSLILWNYLKLKDIYFPIKKMNFLIPVIFLILMFCQISIGAFVSGMDAGKVYNTWPLMGSSYFPDDNQIINLFDFNVFNDPSLVQFIHRNLAYIILLFYVFILIKVYRKNLTDFYYSINLLGLLLIIQIILGIFTLLFDAQIIIASMHQISSVFLVSSSIYFLYLNSNTN